VEEYGFKLRYLIGLEKADPTPRHKLYKKVMRARHKQFEPQSRLRGSN